MPQSGQEYAASGTRLSGPSHQSSGVAASSQSAVRGTGPLRQSITQYAVGSGHQVAGVRDSAIQSGQQFSGSSQQSHSQVGLRGQFVDRFDSASQVGFGAASRQGVKRFGVSVQYPVRIIPAISSDRLSGKRPLPRYLHYLVA